MPKIITYTRQHDFKVEHFTKDSNDKITRETHWFFFLKDNIMVTVLKDKVRGTTETKQCAARDSEYGIQLWDQTEGTWIPCREEIQKAYNDYIAEKELLDANR